MAEAPQPGGLLRTVSGPLDDLALTLPIFLGYHLGVAFLPLRNAADLLTQQLVALANHSILMYAGLTLAIGVAFTAILLVLGREYSLDGRRFFLVAAEGLLYAVAMRLTAAYVVGSLHLDAGAGAPQGPVALTPLSAVIMSLGAGFYEELTFRVGLFGFGRRLVVPLFSRASGPEEKKANGAQRLFATVGWACVVAAVFSGWHYVGAFGDPFELRSFVFRWVCGLVFTAIFVFRGFAPAVWTHALYDIWVLAP